MGVIGDFTNKKNLMPHCKFYEKFLVIFDNEVCQAAELQTLALFCL
jgi:hypothetical protein